MSIKYKWLAENLRELIQKQIRQGVNKLPTENLLCEKYHVSRQTIRQALALLEKEGLIEKRHGSGSYITGHSSIHERNTIGILVRSEEDYIYPAIIHDIRTTLSASGFSSKVFCTDNQVSLEREILKQILKTPLGGLISVGCKTALPNPNVSLYQKLLKKSCPSVFLFNYYHSLPDCPYIKDDNLQGSALLVRHLIEQGHTAIGGIFKCDDLQGMERYQGFIETLLEAKIPFSDKQIGWFDSHDLHKMEKNNDTSFLRDFVQDNLSSCTAVVCYNDLIAYQLIGELKAAGYQLPEDMAVVAFDNSYLSDSGILTVTTVSHKAHEMGILAAQAMITKRKGLPVLSSEVLWTLNIKASSMIDKH